jgi:hypothetical protein
MAFTSEGNTSSDGGGGGRSGCSAAIPRALLFFKRVWSKQFVVKPGKQAKRDGPLIFPLSPTSLSSHTLYYAVISLSPPSFPPNQSKLSSFSHLQRFNPLTHSTHCAPLCRPRYANPREQRPDKNQSKLIKATPGGEADRLIRYASTETQILREQQAHLRLRRGCGSREVEAKRYVLFHHLSLLLLTPPPHLSSAEIISRTGASFQSQIPSRSLFDCHKLDSLALFNLSVSSTSRVACSL